MGSCIERREQICRPDRLVDDGGELIASTLRWRRADIAWNGKAFETAVRNSPDGRAILDELAKVTDRLLRHVVLRQPELQPMYEARL